MAEVRESAWRHHLDGLCVHGAAVAPDGRAWIAGSDGHSHSMVRDPAIYVVAPASEDDDQADD